MFSWQKELNEFEDELRGQIRETRQAQALAKSRFESGAGSWIDYVRAAAAHAAALASLIEARRYSSQ